MAGGTRHADMRHLVRGVFRQQDKGAFLTLNLLRQHWPDVVGPELGARTYPQRLEGGALWIAAPDACWAYELQFFKPELLGSVQAFLESRAVSDVRFLVGSVPAPPPGAAAATAPAGQGARRRPATAAQAPEAPETPAALARAAATIGDPALRAVFQRSLAKQRRGRERSERTAQPGRSSNPAPAPPEDPEP